MTEAFTVALPSAHPRSRGENPHRKDQDPCVPGSSPLTRGKRRSQAVNLPGDGLIPAHAGKTGNGVGTHGVSPAHPRSRGENCARWRTRTRQRGSSPLTRGKPPGPGSACRPWGLIPAHAGKTSGRGGPRPQPEAHPRSRGENAPTVRPGLRGTGSSPLTRGKRCLEGLAVDRRRLIPAHAGKTLLARPNAPEPTAHPRSRGENSSLVATPTSAAGSSPLTRGKRRLRRR